jgi:hypothetical protein
LLKRNFKVKGKNKEIPDCKQDLERLKTLRELQAGGLHTVFRKALSVKCVEGANGDTNTWNYVFMCWKLKKIINIYIFNISINMASTHLFCQQFD